jgi:hypothetical protein
MTFSSTVQTTTAPVTLTTTEMNNAEVVSASGNNIVVKDSNGQQRTFSDSDFRNMGLVIMMDGRPVMASQLKTGDRVNAVMLTSSPSGTGSAGTTYGSTASRPRPAPGRRHGIDDRHDGLVADRHTTAPPARLPTSPRLRRIRTTPQPHAGISPRRRALGPSWAWPASSSWASEEP